VMVSGEKASEKEMVDRIVERLKAVDVPREDLLPDRIFTGKEVEVLLTEKGYLKAGEKIDQLKTATQFVLTFK